MKQRFPIKCTLCRSNKQKTGKVFDAVSDHRSQALRFMQQHCATQVHRKAWDAHLKPKDTLLERVKCEGLHVHDEGTLLSLYAHHFETWLAWRSTQIGAEQNEITWKGKS